MSNTTFMRKMSITLNGTSFDRNGTIILTSNPNGVRIEKNSDSEDGDITLTVAEMKAIIKSVEENFNQKDEPEN